MLAPRTAAIIRKLGLFAGVFLRLNGVDRVGSWSEVPQPRLGHFQVTQLRSDHRIILEQRMQHARIGPSEEVPRTDQFRGQYGKIIFGYGRQLRKGTRRHKVRDQECSAARLQ